MAVRSYNSRREVEQYNFHPTVTLLVPLAAILLQSYLPRLFWGFTYLDLPVIVVVFFSVARRNPIIGTITGALIGLLQDALTAQSIGINGIAKSVVGYLAASIGVRVDVENTLTRVLMSFGFTLLNSLLYFFVQERILGMAVHWPFVHDLLRSLVTAVVAVPLFAILDLTKRRE
jgi:rod shape-determining protein MreD